MPTQTVTIISALCGTVFDAAHQYRLRCRRIRTTPARFGAYRS